MLLIILLYYFLKEQYVKSNLSHFLNNLADTIKYVAHNQSVKVWASDGTLFKVEDQYVLSDS